MNKITKKPTKPSRLVDLLAHAKTRSVDELRERAELAVQAAEVLLKIAFSRSRGLRRGDLRLALSELYSIKQYLAAPRATDNAAKKGVSNGQS